MSFIENLQNKPYETRVKILWGTVLVVGVILIALFVFNLKNTIGNIDGKFIDLNPQPAAIQTQTNFAAVERIESTTKLLNIYFNFNNPTTDILNVPKLTDITLEIKDQKINPVRISDRQGKTFPAKILSKSQNFGILTFAPSDAKTATLIFDQMFMEQNPSNLLQQQLNLDFEKLLKSGSVRN